ncbi:MAG: ABC transporter ATP-binding protein [Dehalococcoidia bacterium]|nr:ABC transporter ATP-binding protein [Dehalococcoidia bacterium]
MRKPPCRAILNGKDVSNVPLITADRLTKRYGTSVLALDQFTVSIEPGIVGLVGSNGAGKSTFIKILLGLIEPTAGSATVLDYDVATQGPELRQYVGYMPEHDSLPGDMVASEFVAHMARMSGLPATAARERAAETLRHVGLFEERYRHIKGYSTGMRQRVKLAQALVHDPRILFLDEPTNGLDPAGRDEMLDLVHRTGTEFGIAVMMSSHLLAEIERVCDHIVVIEGGKLLRQGSIDEFTARRQAIGVEVEHGEEALASVLAARGLSAIVDGRNVMVALDGDAAYTIVRDTVADLELPLIRLEQARGSLEEIFRDQAKETPVAPR